MNLSGSSSRQYCWICNHLLAQISTSTSLREHKLLFTGFCLADRFLKCVRSFKSFTFTRGAGKPIAELFKILPPNLFIAYGAPSVRVSLKVASKVFNESTLERKQERILMTGNVWRIQISTFKERVERKS